MLPEKFRNFIAEQNLLHSSDLLILAVSGGVDSVVLCELCKRAGYRFLIAHMNFQLRGTESEMDENFVKNLAENYGVDFRLQRVDAHVYAAKHGMGIQEAARALRYAWFDELMKKETEATGSQVKTLLAHHADDSVETLMMNFFRGTGIRGLHGILPKQGAIIRPLLFAQKEELVRFATEENLEYVTDSSNLKDDYTRNFFRNKLIPQIEELFPQVRQNLKENTVRFAEVEQLYNQSIALYRKSLCQVKGDEVHIPVLKLQKCVPLRTLVFELFGGYGFQAGQIDEIIALFKSDSGKYIVSPTHRILKNRKWLIISPIQTTVSKHVLIEDAGTYIFNLGTIIVSNPDAVPAKLPSESDIALLDSGMIHFPLLLRPWKTGDYFYPLGMQKKKKLSRFFIDQKLSLLQKEKVWVLESNKKIVWVLGMRIDNRFRISEKTKTVVRLSLKMADGSNAE